MEWLGQKFIDDAAHLKEINPEAYEHEYLGVPNGDGGNVFEYLEIRDITDEEISHMDKIFQGCDWGFSLIRMLLFVCITIITLKRYISLMKFTKINGVIGNQQTRF